MHSTAKNQPAKNRDLIRRFKQLVANLLLNVCRKLTVVVAGLGRHSSADNNDEVSPPQLPAVGGVGHATCTDQSGFQSLSATSGYLAAFDTKGGCPWLIAARPGQRITVVAYDFGWPPAADPSTSPGTDNEGEFVPGWPDVSAETTGPACPVFATLKEYETTLGGRAVRLCEVRHRRTVIYSSLSHQLIIRLKSTDLNVTSARGQRLFLHYEGMQG